MRYNGDGGNNYDDSALVLTGITTPTAGSATANSGQISGYIPGVAATAGSAGRLVVDIPFYAGTTFRKIAGYELGYNDEATATADASVARGQQVWRSTAAITSIVFLGNGEYIAGSVLCLYGVN
jgi:hypothetical protein